MSPGSLRSHPGTNFDAGQRVVLETIALGLPLPQALEQIVRLIERQTEGLLCSIVLVDAHGRIRTAAAPNLPTEFTRAIDGAEIGPQAGSCGTAAYTGRPMIVADIATHASWIDYRHLALPHGLRACWSTPILEAGGKVLGTFAMYYREVRTPAAQEMEWIAAATHLASIAILSDRGRRSEVDRRRMEQEVRVGEHLRAVILDSVGDAIFYLSVEGEGHYRFLSVNRALTSLFGIAASEIVGTLLEDRLREQNRLPTLEHYKLLCLTGERQSWEESIPARTGRKHCDITASPVLDAEGRCTNIVVTIHDVTARIATENERTLLQSQLHHAQRMQALGTLAGGIAHDFNNILAAIGGNTHLVLEELPPESPLRERLLEIEKASGRAIELVRQILTFSRSATPVYEIVDPRAIANEALRLLRASLPSQLNIETRFAADALNIRADSTQLHQIVMNLATNAAHAMLDRAGAIEISIDTVTAQEVPQGSMRLDASAYVRLRVTDHGCGMDAATLKRAFEPFFTTRPPGEGTGLGLSVVHGIVASHRGVIDIDSEPGRGTVVSIYLPASDVPVEIAPTEAPSRGQGERVMYVDDEEALVLLLDLALSKMGYRVTGHCDPAEALADFRARPDEFDVVITDLAMPGLSGPDLAMQLRAIRPDVPIIMTSGYIRDEDRQEAQRLGVTQLVYKSNTIERLGEVLAQEISALNRS